VVLFELPDNFKLSGNNYPVITVTFFKKIVKRQAGGVSPVNGKALN
jgi:hypothetical protein